MATYGDLWQLMATYGNFIQLTATYGKSPIRRPTKKCGVVLATLIPVTSVAAGDRTDSGSSIGTGTGTGTANSIGGRAHAITNGLRMTQVQAAKTIWVAYAAA